MQIPIPSIPAKPNEFVHELPILPGELEHTDRLCWTGRNGEHGELWRRPGLGRRTYRKAAEKFFRDICKED